MAAENPDLQSIKERLEKLERQNRWLRRTGLAALLLAATAVAMGQARPSRTVTANKFVLQDRQGRARITISTPAFGGAAVGMGLDDPAIWISDEKGQDRVILTPNSLRFSNGRGQAVASLVVGGNGGPSLGFFGRAKNKFVRQAGGPSIPSERVTLDRTGLYFNDTDGTPAIMLGGVKSLKTAETRETAARELTFFDAKGKQRVDLGIWGQTGPVLHLADRGSAALMEVKGDSPQLRVSDAEGFSTVIGSEALVTPTSGETHRTSAASVVLLGKDGKVLWSAPSQ